MTDITKTELARVYALATERIQVAAVELYEELFDSNGEARTNPGQVTNLVSSFRAKAGFEMDMVREAAIQYAEQHHNLNGKSKQTSLLDYNG